MALSDYPNIRPSLLMDFANSARLNAKFQPNRASTGTVMGINGFIGVIGLQTPRFQYNLTTGACEGYLVEEQRTNFVTYSADLGNASWTKVNVTATSNVATSPDGGTTASSVVPTATTNLHGIWPNLLTTAAATFSVFAKANGYSRMALNEFNATGASSAIIDLSNGSGASGDTTVTDFGNGWYRVSWYLGVTGSPKAFRVIVLPNGGSGENPNNFTWLANGTSGILVWGAQSEDGTFPTSYIPTTTASVTRAADVPYIDSGEFYTSRGGTLLFEGSPRDDNNSSKSVYLTGYFNGSTERLSFISDTTGSTLNARYGATALALGTLPSTATSMKLVAAFDPTNFAACRNGGVVQSTTGTFAAGANRFFIGNTFFGGGAYTAVNGIVKKIAYWPSKLTNTQLQKLTA